MATILMLEFDHNVAICLEGPQELDEAKVPEVSDDTAASNSGGQSEQGGQVVDIPPAELAKLKVSELKQELTKSGHPANGLKAVLLERLKAALQQRLPLLSQADQAACATDDLKGFSPTAQWRLLQPIVHMIEEPQNVVPLHAPIVPEDDAAFVPPSMTLWNLLIMLLSSEWQSFQNSITMAILLLWMENNNGKRKCQSRVVRKWNSGWIMGWMRIAHHKGGSKHSFPCTMDKQTIQLIRRLNIGLTGGQIT